MAKGMPWLKLYTEIVDDPKMAGLSDASRWHWIAVLCLARESETPGTINLTVDQMAWRLRCDKAAFIESVEEFCQLNLMAKETESVYRVVNFEARQARKASDELDAVAERMRRYRRNQKEKGFETGPLPTALRNAALERDGYQCQYCGTDDGPFEVDHIHPVSLGGAHELDNLKTACRACNRAKGNKTSVVTRNERNDYGDVTPFPSRAEEGEGELDAEEEPSPPTPPPGGTPQAAGEGESNLPAEVDPPPKRGFAYPAEYEAWWQAYPDPKSGKREALRAWLAVKARPPTALLIAAVEAQKHSDKWRRGFIVGPAKWLKDGRWEDTTAVPASTYDDAVRSAALAWGLEAHSGP